jgi:poly(hydroxyalkanoate) granule-associated protein
MTRTKRNTNGKQLQKLRATAIAKVEAAKDAALSRVGEFRTRAAGAMTQLEKAFETRVAKTISRLGVPSTRDVRALSRQVAELKVSVEKLRRARA